MAASSSNNIVELLEKLLKIFKEEKIFDQTGDQPVVQFFQPEDLQVNFLCKFEQIKIRIIQIIEIDGLKYYLAIDNLCS